MDPATFQHWQWLFPAAITVHNLEEAIWLPAWSQKAGRWHAGVGAFEFRFAVAVLTVLLLNAPVCAWILYFGVCSRTMSPGRLAFATALGIPVLLGIIPLLFRVGAISRRSLPGRV